MDIYTSQLRAQNLKWLKIGNPDFEQGFLFFIFLDSQLHLILDVVGYAWRPR